MELDIFKAFALCKSALQTKNDTGVSSGVSYAYSNNLTVDTEISELQFRTHNAWGMLGAGSSYVMDVVYA